jgi:hypothetical protein
MHFLVSLQHLSLSLLLSNIGIGSGPLLRIGLLEIFYMIGIVARKGLERLGKY